MYIHIYCIIPLIVDFSEEPQSPLVSLLVQYRLKKKKIFKPPNKQRVFNIHRSLCFSYISNSPSHSPSLVGSDSVFLSFLLFAEAENEAHPLTI